MPNLQGFLRVDRYSEVGGKWKEKVEGGMGEKLGSLGEDTLALAVLIRQRFKC